MFEPLRPALLRLSLFRVLQRREDGGPAQEINNNEQRQQQEPRVIFINWTGAAAAAAPACHYVAVVAVVQLQSGTRSMVVSEKKRAVLGRNAHMTAGYYRKIRRETVQLLNQVFQCRGFGIVLVSFCLQPRFKLFSRARSQATSCPRAVLCAGLFREEERCARQPVDAESRAVALSTAASPKKPPPQSAPFTHHRLTAHKCVNLKPLFQRCHFFTISVYKKRRRESRSL